MTLAEARASGVPISRLLGQRWFYTISLALTAGVFDPRPDSETLIDAALRAFPDPEQPIHVIDLGCGSGNLLLAILAERPRAWGIGIDRAPIACALARANARRLDLADRASFIVNDFTKLQSWEAHHRFNLLLCNPPYIPSADINALAPEVAIHDPWIALDGSVDGFKSYNELAPVLPILAAPRAHAFLEISPGQADYVRMRVEAHGLLMIASQTDLAGRNRCLEFIKP